LRFKINWRGEKYSIEITKNKIAFKPLSSIRRPVLVEIYGKDYFLHPNEILKVTY
jgi:trehalose/maltose hydrolase-like predicted phosphorylase